MRCNQPQIKHPEISIEYTDIRCEKGRLFMFHAVNGQIDFNRCNRIIGKIDT